MKADHNAGIQRIVTADLLENLPIPVQRFMAHTGVIGTPWIYTVRAKWSGVFRLGRDRPWMPMIADQYYTTDHPSFLWKARFKMAGLPLLRARDTYKAAHGHMFAKLANIFTVFDVRGKELDQGSMARYLNEMVLIFPSALLGENVAWQDEDDHNARVIFNDGGNQVSARLTFDELGRLLNFSTMRYRENNGSFSLDPWSTPVTSYGQRAGLNLPTRGQAVWNLADGDLPYADLEILEVEYNCEIPTF
jgi:hypothetical protein